MAEDAPTQGKRVIFINRFYWPDESATAQILTDLAEHLGSTGFEVHVVTSRLRYESTGAKAKLPAAESHHSVQVHRLWSTAFGRAGLVGRLVDYLTIYLSFFAFLLRKTRPSDVVVLKTDPPLLSILGWVAGLLRPFKTVAWCQDLFPEVAEHGFEGGALPLKALLAPFRGLRNISLSACDCVVTISDDMTQFLRRQQVRAPVLAIPNWAIQQADPSPETCQEMRAQWELEGRFVLGYSGNLGRAHDIETILDALPYLLDLENLTILFIGGGSGYEILRKRLNGYPPEFVRFLPYQPRNRLGETLKVPDVHWFSLLPDMTPLIFPSKFYGIIAAGRPMVFVGDPSSALARQICDTECGMVVAPGDGNGFANSVKTLYADASRRTCFGENSMELASGDAARSRRLSEWNSLLGRIGSPERKGGLHDA